MRLIRQIFPVLLLAVAMAACKKPPEFPKTPEISFGSISKQVVVQKRDTSLRDSVTLTINFRDGDGDLGRNYGDDNFFCRVFVKHEGVFKEFIDSISVPGEKTVINKNGRFMPLSIDGKARPLEGSINYGPTLNFSYILIQDEYLLKFQIYIKDNQGNTSNTIETPEVLVKIYPQ